MTDTYEPTSPCGGVDAVAGQPPVPLSVWYRTGDTPGVGRDELIRKSIDQYSSPGQSVVVIDRGASPHAATWPADRAYVRLPQPGLLAGIDARVDLIVLGWSYANDPRATPEMLDELFQLLHAHLNDRGHAILVFDQPRPGTLHAGYVAPLITAATRAGLGYLQSVVYLDTGLRGWVLDTTAPSCQVAWSVGWQQQAHRYLLVLRARAGRHD